MSIKRRFFLVNILFAIVAFFYGIVIAIRNKLYDSHILKSYTFKIPIISVGNIVVGGTGKTTHVEYLIRLLKNEFDVNVLSRGYKRKSSGFLLSDEQSTVSEIGDEPRQMKRKFRDIALAVDKNRVRGIKTLESNFIHKKPPIILLDDAFQHRAVCPGFSILLIDINNLPQNDYFLPLGTLRDSPAQQKRANIILFTKSENKLSPIDRRIFIKSFHIQNYQSTYFTRIVYKDIVPLFPLTNPFDINQINNHFTVLLITAIAKPSSLLDFCKSKTENIQHLTFSDHHFFTNADISKIIFNFDQILTTNKLIITTEKDAVRLIDSAFVDQIRHLPIYYLTIEVDFWESEEKEKFNQEILKYVRANKSIC